MKVLVAIKRVVDYKASIHIKSDQTGVDTDHVKMSINPFDEIAIEEAVRLKEQGLASDIIVVSMGTRASQEILRGALAMGADRALLLETTQTLEPLAVAHILKAVIERENPSLVLLGKQAIDSDNNQVGQILAGLLEWPQATFASRLTVTADRIEVMREIDGGLETVSMSLPAVVTTDLRLNEPRFLTLPNIVKAKQKPLQCMSLEELNIDIAPRLQVLQVTRPLPRPVGIKVATVAELVEKLRQRQVIP